MQNHKWVHIKKYEPTCDFAFARAFTLAKRAKKNKTEVNIKLTIAYDGSCYLGWQKTKNGPSIESTLEEVLVQILQEPCVLQAASRTDAGVHASRQIVNFKTYKTPLSLERLHKSLGALLPKDIAVIAVEKAPDDFHPTLDCTGKEYHYHVCFGGLQTPFDRHFSWHFPYILDISLMQEAASILIGERDFSAFCNVKKEQNYEHYVRHIRTLNVVELPNQRLRFEIEGNNFLYRMVRNLVGTLVYIGCGKISISDLPHILANKKRSEAGVTAPAHGLFLHHVHY